MTLLFEQYNRELADFFSPLKAAMADFPFEVEESLNEAKKKDKPYERTASGKIKYKNELYPGFNKPKKYTGKGKFKRRVLAKDGDEIKVINYGHKDYSDYTKHKDPERRANFRKRHGCDPVSSLKKTTKKYWACQDLWGLILILCLFI